MSQRALRLYPRARSFSLSLLARPLSCLLALSLALCSRIEEALATACGREGRQAAAQGKGGCIGGGSKKMSGEDEQQEQTIAEDLVVTKYKMGGDIANRECGLRGLGVEAERERCRSIPKGAGAAGSCGVSYRGERTGPRGAAWWEDPVSRRGRSGPAWAGVWRCGPASGRRAERGPRQAQTLGRW